MKKFHQFEILNTIDRVVFTLHLLVVVWWWNWGHEHVHWYWQTYASHLRSCRVNITHRVMCSHVVIRL